MADEYWVVASDGKEYGPAGIALLAQWVRERRLIRTSPVRKGTGAPADAASYPEIASLFAAQESAGTAAGAVATGGIAIPQEFRVWGFVEKGWDLVRENWLVLGAMFFIQFAIGAVPHIGFWVQFIVGGAISVGIWRAVLGMIDGRKPTVGMMFEGFDRFADAFLGTLVATALVILGCIALIVPGIILALMWLFLYPILGETRLGFWPAMRASAVLTEGYRWRLFLLALAGIPVLILGLVALCVGVFIAEAVMVTAFALAYRFLQRQKGPIAPAV